MAAHELMDEYHADPIRAARKYAAGRVTVSGTVRLAGFDWGGFPFVTLRDAPPSGAPFHIECELEEDEGELIQSIRVDERIIVQGRPSLGGNLILWECNIIQRLTE
jgi:hypothetical protein